EHILKDLLVDGTVTNARTEKGLNLGIFKERFIHESKLDSIFKVAFGIDFRSTCGSCEGLKKLSISDQRLRTRIECSRDKIISGKQIGFSHRNYGVEPAQVGVFDSQEGSSLMSLSQKDGFAMDGFIHKAPLSSQLYRSNTLSCGSSVDHVDDGYDVTKGDIATYQPYAIGRVKFDEFNPERWFRQIVK
ncbi:hypothetical protein M8C21_015908, partial [Ambrosia artemisiifolia]